jgi:hypothetical protein
MGTLLVYNGAKWVSIEPHAFSHATGGKDELMASLIGAATEDYVDSVIAHVADSVIAHVADTDPHPDYLLQSESDTLYDSIGTANAAILSHVQSPDPHPNYLNQLQADSLYDSYGAAASEIGDHLTANNPHPGYLTQSTANALYDFFGTADTKLADHISLENPHPIYLTQAEGDTVYSALNHNHPYASINHKTQHEPLGNDSLGGYALTVHAHTGSNISGNISGNAANITGIAAIANGGTGASTAAQALTNLGAAAASHNHAASAINSGTVAITNGGTGASTAAGALTNLGAAPATHTHAASAITSGTIAIANGGTGASTAAAARTKLGAAAASHTHAASYIEAATFPFAAGWSEYSPTYRCLIEKYEAIMFLAGLVERSATNQPLILVLPTEYIPFSRKLFMCWGMIGSTYTPCRVDVEVNGNVSLIYPITSAAISWLSLDSIIFNQRQ